MSRGEDTSSPPTWEPDGPALLGPFPVGVVFLVGITVGSKGYDVHVFNEKGDATFIVSTPDELVMLEAIQDEIRKVRAA